MTTEPSQAFQQGATARIADFSLAVEIADLPEDVVHATQRIILDCIACAIAAFDTEPAQSVIAHKRHLGGSPQARLVVDGDLLSCTAATYVNTQLVNVMDADETLLNFSHIASTIVMPALAVGEMTGASAADLVTAVAVGFEIASRVGLALPNYAISDGATVVAPSRGFSWAAFGTAAAAARLLRLDSRQLANAFGIVMTATPVHGCLERFTFDAGQWHKAAMYGAIAEAGVSAALLSQQGFRADETILDDESSFFRSFGATEWFPHTLFDELGSRWRIAETSIKPYPFCRYAHGAIDAFDTIVQANQLVAHEIEEVIVTSPPFAFLQAIVDAPMPADVMAIASSLPFAFAMVAARVPPGPAWWEPAVLGSESAGLAHRVRSVVNENWGSVMTEQILTEGFFRRLPLTVTVHATDGRMWEESRDFAQGDPWAEGFEMSDEALGQKVVEFTRRQLGVRGSHELIDAALHLVGAPDLTRIVSAMVRNPKTIAHDSVGYSPTAPASPRGSTREDNGAR